MKINWFSPIPPAPTAIADVTERVIPALSRRMEVTVWTDTDDFLPERFPGVEVRSCLDVERLWPEINFADFSIYHIGNDVRFHGHYAWMLERHPGIVVLHDYNLHELQRERHLRQPGGLAAFNRYVLRTAGAGALQAVLACQRGQLAFEDCLEQVPLIESVTRFATGIISFNEAIKEPLRPLTRAPLFFCPLPLADRDRFPPLRQPAFTADGPLELVMFGFLNSPNRRLDAVLEALAGFPDGRVRLTLFGHVGDQSGLQQLIGRLGLGAKVRYLGYLEQEAMENVLSASHLAVNLRNPSRGESSDALLKAWRHALPVVVTETGYYRTLPHEVVLPIPPGEEVEGLRGMIRDFREDPERFQQVGRAAHRFLVAHHSNESFAEGLETFLNRAEAYRKTSFVPPFARRMGRLIRQDVLSPQARERLHRSVAEELLTWGARPQTPCDSRLSPSALNENGIH